MITYRRTSILESTAQTLVNTVNCVGVMGKGIAKAFKERDPAMYKAYKKICDRNLLEPGKLWLWQGLDGWVLNFPTKIHWRNPSRLEWIEAGLIKFIAEYASRGITEVSFPRLGCGNGGLEWAAVKPLMESYLRDLNIQVYIHDYMVDIGLPEHLEQISERLKGDAPHALSFDGFLAAMRRIAEIGGEDLVDLRTKQPFQACMDMEGNLFIKSAGIDICVEQDELRGIWLSLVRGLVTREMAGWSMAEGGSPILSMLSLLPMARPIQIEHLNGAPELAVELRTAPSSTVLSAGPGDQAQLEWA